MQRKRKQNSDHLSSKHNNGVTNHDQKLDDGEEKIAQNENGLNSSEQLTNSDVSCTTKQASARGLMKSFCSVSCIGVLKVVILVMIVPPFLNYASLQREYASLRPHGELYDGPRGDKLFMNCSGKGLPVVMMDTPGGYSSDLWLLVQTNVAKFTKVCVYDRAGLGFSERVTPRFHDNQQENMSSDVSDFKYEKLRPTAENMAADIHHLIKNISKTTNNVLLVGGGLGAINARFYARFYENIFGIVLINPFHEKMFTDKVWNVFWYEHFLPSIQMEQISAALGVTRLGIISGLYKPSLLKNHVDNEVLIRLKYLTCNMQHLSAGIMERYYINESLAQLKILQKLKPFPKNISISLISSKNFSDNLPRSLNQFWFKNQELFVKELLSKGEQRIVDSDFNAVYFKNVEIIVKTIKKLVHKFRKSVKQSANI